MDNMGAADDVYVGDGLAGVELDGLDKMRNCDQAR